MEKRIMIGIPVNRWLSPQFSRSLNEIVFFLLHRSGFTVDINYDSGSVVSSQRNKIFQAALKEKMDLLFIDSDMVFKTSDLAAVLDAAEKHNADLTGGLCFMRREPFKPVVFSEDLTETEGTFRGIPMKDIPVYPFVCKGVGCAFLYITLEAIDHIYKHYEKPFNHIEIPNGDVLGEDLSFMHRCNKLNMKIVCVSNVDIGHITERIVRRRDHIEFMKFHKRLKRKVGKL